MNCLTLLHRVLPDGTWQERASLFQNIRDQNIRDQNTRDQNVRKESGRSHATTISNLRQQNFWLRARSLCERILRLSRRAPRRLRLCESLPLGERRFVAVVEFEQTRFLLGGTSASLVLLARLGDTADKADKEVPSQQAGEHSGGEL